MSEIRFDDRVAIITGAAGALGRGYAKTLAERGARVLVNDLGCDMVGQGADAQPAQQVADEIVGLGGEAIANVRGSPSTSEPVRVTASGTSSRVETA